MHRTALSTRVRCLAVAAGLTAALWGTLAGLAGVLGAGAGATGAASVPASTEQVLVRLCEAALVATVAWAWLQALAGVRDAWRGTGPGSHAVIRRLALAACGAALGGTLVVPAQAAPPVPGRPAGPDVLTGLPLPERAEGPAHPPRRRTVVVRAGDSLWALAARALRDPTTPPPTDLEITEAWHRLYALNRAVVGPDPGLIRPGQVLRLTQEQP